MSLLPIVSKLFERNMYNQIIAYLDKFLSPYLFGFRKGHSTEQCLIIMLEAWKKALDGKHNAGAILTDLSKAFDSWRSLLQAYPPYIGIKNWGAIKYA